MTVTEIREILAKLEADGKGDYDLIVSTVGRDTGCEYYVYELTVIDKHKEVEL